MDWFDIGEMDVFFRLLLFLLGGGGGAAALRLGAAVGNIASFAAKETHIAGNW